MEQQDVKAVILRVTIDGQEVITAALGETMTGVPATPEMHFRNGAVAIFYMSTPAAATGRPAEGLARRSARDLGA